MVNYLGRRLVMLIPVLLGITLLSFTLMNSLSGDIIDALSQNTGGVVSAEVKEQLRVELGLHRPFFVRYGDWVIHLLKGDMGNSYLSGRAVSEIFIEKIPNTIYLTCCTFLLTITISIPLGIISAVTRNCFVDYLIRFFCFIGNAVPGFFLSLLLILFFAVKLEWFSVIGNQGLKSLVLPAVTLAVPMTAKYIRQVRAAVLEELNQDYVFAGRARGIRESVILSRSVLKAAMLNVITLLSLSIGSLLGGTAIVETIFMWDGVGKLAIDAIAMRDYPVVQAYVVWMALIYLFVNLVSDVLCYLLDPRLRQGEEQWT